jgi:uncharacterized protein
LTNVAWWVVAAVVAAGLVAPPPASAQGADDPPARGLTYVTVSDGVKIAVAVSYPPGFSRSDRRSWPAVLEMDGYDGASGWGATGPFRRQYVVVRASVRGTGCSGGTFDLLSWRTARDGRDIIDRWIAKQPWSNGRVGLIGHSYRGLTGIQVAATAPKHLSAVAVSGLVDDLYRGMFHMGGVLNTGFPLLWKGAYRPSLDVQASAPQLMGDDEQCRANIEQRKTSNVVQPESLVRAYAQREATADSWAIRNSPLRFAHRVTAPTQLVHQYQDEQTGPRGGPVLFERLPRGVPKRLIMSNGFHNDGVWSTKEWIDCWVLHSGGGCGEVNDPRQRVRLHFENRHAGRRLHVTKPYVGRSYPLPETRWRRLYLGADGRLRRAARVADGEVRYVSTQTGRQTTGSLGRRRAVEPLAKLAFTPGPDAARYDLAFDKPAAIAGPMPLRLWLSSTATDTDVFADVLDVNDRTGEVTYVQRGVLRASHRAVDVRKSDRIARGPFRDVVYRYWHPHVGPQPLTPLEPQRLEIDINPVGHVFRKGHRMVLLVHSPPAADPLSQYAWSPEQPTAVNTIHQAPGMRSSLLVPVLPVLPPMAPRPPACGELAGQPCFSGPVGR